MPALHDMQRDIIQMDAGSAGHVSCYQNNSGPFN